MFILRANKQLKNGIILMFLIQTKLNCKVLFSSLNLLLIEVLVDGNLFPFFLINANYSYDSIDVLFLLTQYEDGHEGPRWDGHGGGHC